MTDHGGRRPETIAAAFGVAADSAYGAVAPALYTTSTYVFPGFEQPGPYDYGRAGNPTRDMLANALTHLEGGAGAVVTASGMAAADLIFGRLPQGALIVAPHDSYGGTQRLLKVREALGQIKVRFVDQSNLDAVSYELRFGASLLFIETPSNPLMRVVDIQRLSHLAHEAGALVVVDNTFLSPALQSPIALGADYVLHSTTKYINGHSDVIGGAVIASHAPHVAELRAWANTTGCAAGPFEAWLTLRGLRTLFARLDHQQRNAAVIAAFLARHPKVSAVHYPGLPTHPGHHIANVQQRGFGAMLSFELAGGPPSVRRFLNALGVFTLAESLGGIESLVAHPMSMTHADMMPKDLDAAGITDGLLRLSVGLEHQSDLVSDLNQALAGLQLIGGGPGAE